MERTPNLTTRQISHPTGKMDVVHPVDRASWRRWLRANHRSAEDVWLVSYKAHTGKPRIPYNDAVEEALCFGWIDSTVRTIDDDRLAQRFSPRRPTSNLSQMNRERVDKLIKARKMTKAGLAAIAHAYEPGTTQRFVVPPDILAALRADPVAWRNYRRFPAAYRRIRVAYIESARRRPQEFEKRLRHFVAMTAKNKRFGFVKEMR